MDCGLLKTAFTLQACSLGTVNRTLHPLGFRCWGSLHMSHLCASPFFFSIDDKGFWVDPCKEQKYIKRHCKHHLGVQIEQVELYRGVIDLRCAGERRSTSRGTK